MRAAALTIRNTILALAVLAAGAAATARPAAHAGGGGDIVGTWVNSDPYTRDITRIVGTAGFGDQRLVHEYGACAPTACDWGTALAVPTTGPLNTSVFTAQFHTPFAVRTQVIVKYWYSQTLRVSTFTHFTDHSGRPDYTMVDYFRLV